MKWSHARLYLEANFVVQAGLPIFLHLLQSHSVMGPADQDIKIVRQQPISINKGEICVYILNI